TYGSVYRGEHWLFKDELAVALKLLDVRLDGKEKQEQFAREASLLRKLKHPHILPLIDAGTHRGIPYLVTIYASGGSLRQVLQEQHERPFPVDIALHILQQVGEALVHAHNQHIIHRDLKPENILFGPQGEVFLADFGLAVTLESTATGFVGSQGTPLYMAPEQFEGRISSKSDQYALACMGYELLAGRRPFLPPYPGWETIWFHHAKVAPAPPTQFNAQIPPHVEQVLLRALAKDRADRYSSVTAFLASLNPAPARLVGSSSITNLPTRPAWEQHVVDTPADIPTPDAQVANLHTLRMDSQEPSTEVSLAVDALALLDLTASEEYRKQGHAFRDAGVYDRALQAYQQAIQLDPQNPLAYYGQAKVFWERQQYTKALQAYDT
ncbi:MAG: protein kinase domain-containing protein, partial [Ktedonobacteraceae bacterium]